jgi:hypothetical protein
MRDNQLDDAPGRIRTADPQIRSLVLCQESASIIPCSTAPKLSNNITQKGLAFERQQSGTVASSGS